ncbi:MAG: cupin domain-containing protein [Desulfobaccales bacterium]
MSYVRFIGISPERREDPGGMSWFLWQGRVRDPQHLMESFHFLSINPGHIRGNHLHPGHAEWLYPFHGTGVLIWEAAPGQVRARVVSGDCTLIHIPPGLPHALKNPGPEILYLLAWREAASHGATGPETVPHALAG